MTTELIFFGDTGGHYDALAAALIQHGINPETGHIPAGKKVVHVGDLIHKGPDTIAILRMIELFRQNSPGQWLQTIGNHEAQHLGGKWFWECNCQAVGVEDLLRAWKHIGFLNYAYGFEKVSGRIDPHSRQKIEDWSEEPLLVTHAGLTSFSWEHMAKSATSPVEAAAKINDTRPALLWRAGMLWQGFSSPLAGPVWAVGGSEVFPSWREAEAELPFHQLFGHTTGFVWSMNRWWYGLHKGPYRSSTILNVDAKATLTTVDGKVLIGIDPGFDTVPETLPQPSLVLTASD